MEHACSQVPVVRVYQWHVHSSHVFGQFDVMSKPFTLTHEQLSSPATQSKIDPRPAPTTAQFNVFFILSKLLVHACFRSFRTLACKHALLPRRPARAYPKLTKATTICTDFEMHHWAQLLRFDRIPPARERRRLWPRDTQRGKKLLFPLLCEHPTVQNGCKISIS